ncbi:MAG TPA: ATP-binding protein [Gaiellaceae bacterium]|nr:ATP-binding protein [Gaiellaceae bacterium]
MGSLAARAYLGFGMAMIAVHLAVGGSVGLYDGLGLTSVAAIAIGAAWYRPAAWRGWAVIGVSQALFAAGDFEYHLFRPATFPALPDVFYLAGSAAFVAGVLLLMGKSFDWGDIASNVDALLITVALGLSGWMLLLDDSFRFGLSPAQIVAIIYLVADLAVLGLLIRIALAPGRRNPSYWLMFAALIPLFVGDGTYVLPALGNSYHFGGWEDACWLASYVLLGVAALHPSMGTFARGTSTEGGSQPMRRVVVGGIALLTLPASAFLENFVRGSVDVPVIAVGGSLLLAGMVARAVILVRELDELRQRAEESERRFRMIFERAPIGISVGRNGIMSETNPALQRMLGYTGDEFAQMHYTQVTRPDDRSLVMQQELDAGMRDAFVADKQYVHKDGTPLQTRVNVALDLEGGLGMSLIEDVTEQRELEEQLLQAQKLEAVGKLAGGIAHDFNNLMTGVIGYSELLLRGLDAHDTSRDKLEAIRDSALRASDLTRQLLAFSRRQVMQTEDIDLRDVVDSMDLLLHQVIGKGVRLEKVLGREPVIVRADRTQLEQVVMNLAINAREAMPAGGTLTVAVDNEADEAVLTVADEGAGMDAATQARIFEPFFTTKPLTEGSGLGLSTVHGIVGQSGGTIDVESAVGRGTVFTARLPRVPGTRLPETQAPATLVD